MLLEMVAPLSAVVLERTEAVAGALMDAPVILVPASSRLVAQTGRRP